VNASDNCTTLSFTRNSRIQIPGHCQSFPPGRPIVSDVDSESYAVSKFIDEFLQQIVIKLDSYVRDTDHFQALIQKVNIPAATEAHLFTLDVVSLYTNIPTDEGIACVTRAFRENPDPGRPDASLLTLLKLILQRNDFRFGEQWFLQTQGTAMGKSFAPSYSNIFMGYWESEGLRTHHHKPTLWLRFIDDIFGAWVGSEPDVHQFVAHLNKLNTHIKLELHHSITSVNFLDTTVYWQVINNSKHLRTRVYFKPTDSRCLIHQDSFHPKSTCNGAVKSQMLRYARRCSQKSDFDTATSQLINNLVTQQGYNRRKLRTVKYQLLAELNFLPTRKWEFGFLPCDPIKPCDCCVNHAMFTNVCPGSHATQVSIMIHQRINCQTINAVYAIFCRECNCTVYVGETRNSIRARILAHLGDIDRRSDTPIARHFSEKQHSAADLRFTGIWTRPKSGQQNSRNQTKTGSQIHQHG
jgi:hypothetical protein